MHSYTTQTCVCLSVSMVGIKGRGVQMYVVTRYDFASFMVLESSRVGDWVFDELYVAHSESRQNWMEIWEGANSDVPFFFDVDNSDDGGRGEGEGVGVVR